MAWRRELCRYFSLRVPAGDVEDLVQDALLIFLERRQAMRGPNELGFLRGIARNLVIRRGRVRALEVDADIEGMQSDIILASTRVAAAVLVNMLMSIPFARQNLLILHYVENLSIAEIATEHAVPEGTIKRRLHEARVALRPLLGSVVDGSDVLALRWWLSEGEQGQET